VPQGTISSTSFPGNAREGAARNLLFHPFRILVTLGPGKEGVQGEVGDDERHHAVELPDSTK